MTYPTGADFLEARTLSSQINDRPDIDIFGCYLDKPFTIALISYLRFFRLNLNVRTFPWNTSLATRQQSIERNGHRPPFCIVNISIKTILGCQEPQTEIDRLRTLIESCCDTNQTTFFLLDDHLPEALISYQPTFSSHLSCFYSLLTALYSLQDHQRIFVINATHLSTFTPDYSSWVVYGFPYGLEVQDQLAKYVASTIACIQGYGKKLVLIDLDQTLWPHTLAELDDPLSLHLDTADPTHRFYIDFQQYLKNLRDTSFLLGILSKNSSESINTLFASHTHILSTNDFSSISLSWSSKPDRLRQVCDALRISRSDTLFIDNSIEETALMQASYPEVCSICLHDNPSQFLSIVSSSPYLCSLYRDPMHESRLQSYVAGANHHHDKSYSQRTCQPNVHIVPHSPQTETRALQLLNKTNQFNLNGEKYTSLQLPQSNQIHSLHLRDAYYDYGISSVIIGSLMSSHLHILQWVLSCRAFSKGFEREIILQLLRHISIPIKTISLHVKKTPRNNYLWEYLDSDDYHDLQRTLLDQSVEITIVSISL